MELADILNSGNKLQVIDALSSLSLPSILPKGKNLTAFIKCISSDDAEIRELAISRAGKWSDNPKVALALGAQFDLEEDEEVLFSLALSVTKLIKRKSKDHEKIASQLAEIASSTSFQFDLRLQCAKSLLFAYDKISKADFASSDFENLELYLSIHKPFFTSLLSKNLSGPA